MRNTWKLTALLGAVALGACSVETKDGDASGATAGATAAATAADSAAISPMAGASTGATTGATTGAMAADSNQMRIEVDIKARRLYVLRAGQRADSFRVAVGSERWPTQPGEWTIRQVVWNPDWTPPDESWAEEREPRKAGDPKNPLGRVQLVYDPPRTIHGTNAPESIGKAVSHGSIRMRNEDIRKLGRDVMEASGTQKDEAFFARVQQNRTQKEIVDLARPVPIRVF